MAFLVLITGKLLYKNAQNYCMTYFQFTGNQINVLFGIIFMFDLYFMDVAAWCSYTVQKRPLSTQ